MDASPDTIRSQIIALLPRLRRFALSITGNAGNADDLVQDTVERALRRLHQWEPGTRLDSWMFRIAQNIFIDQARARKRAGAVVTGSFEEASERIGYGGAATADAKITFADTMRALASLPEEQRSAVCLVLIDGMSYRDASEALEIPIGTLTSRIARARDALARQVLGEERSIPNKENGG